jgi:hypothetical protein
MTGFGGHICHPSYVENRGIVVQESLGETQSQKQPMQKGLAKW